MTVMLMKNPSSWLQAAHNRWKYPVSYDWMIVAELFDLTHKVNSKKAKPLKRPWPDPNETKIGKTVHSREDVLRNLERMNRKDSDG